MEQATRNEIAATAAVHRELGPDYEDVAAEGLVERIGAEIDKRVEARLAEGTGRRHPARTRSGGEVDGPGSPPHWTVMALALGSILIGGLTSASVLHSRSGGATALAVIMWIVIAVVNVAYGRRR